MTTQILSDVNSAQTTDFTLIALLPNGRVDARGLWQFLESKKEFANWIKQLIVDYDFVDKKDFDKKIKPLENNKTDYELSIDMAKEICMVSKSQKGKGARKYFIACEQKALELNIKVITEEEQLLNLFPSTDTCLINLTADMIRSKRETDKLLAYKDEVILEIASKVPVKTLRKKINQILKDGVSNNFSSQWDKLYQEFLYTYDINLKVRARNRSQSILDYVEENGYMEDLYNLAIALFEVPKLDNSIVRLND